MKFYIKYIVTNGLIIFLISSAVALSEAQNRSRNNRLAEEAKKAWTQRDLVKAEQTALKALSADQNNLEIILLLADIYREQNQPENELKYLEIASSIPNKPGLVNFRLAEAYFISGDYEKAYLSVEDYLSGNPSPGLIQKADHIKRHAVFAKEAIKSPVTYNPINLGPNINTVYDEYWPSLTVDGSTLIFTRLVPINENTRLKQEDFYGSSFDGETWSLAEPLNSINSPLNEGAQTISADGNLLFFTLCNHPNGFGSCDIWFSRRINGNWTAPMNAGSPLNTESWEGQPSLSSFGDVLYFSSNRRGGKGNKDIWSIELKGWRPDGRPLWGEPKNLGDSINTPGDDISPFIHPNGRDLFFSSDYWPGFGGLDIFRSVRKIDGSWSRATNLGFPLNSNRNEQGLIIDRTGYTAFMASDRVIEYGMDIYSFELDESLRPAPVTYIRGKVADAETGNPVAASVKLTGLEAGLPVETILKADREGIFTVTLPAGQEFAFHVNQPGYLFFSEHFLVENTSEVPEPVYRDIFLVPVKVGSQTHLYNLFFDTGSDKILETSEPELDELTRFLVQNPSLQVEIQGHTDNVGTAAYNLDLSEKRAQAVVDYLTARGIAIERLTSKGYGFTMPVESNETEAGRARNRRTTVKITGVLPPLRE